MAEVIDKELGVVVASQEEKFWLDVKERATKALEQLNNERKINEAIAEIADARAKQAVL